MASYYKKLKADLARAAGAGIITNEQADKVWEHSRTGGPFSSLRATHWIAAAAGLFISLGVILIAAHNWDKIGPSAKILAYLLLFAGASEASLRLGDKPGASMLEILWFFMPALGIGLYAQIFNLSGDPVKPYLAWAGISAPLAILATRKTPAYLCSILLFAVLYYGTLTSGNMLTLSGSYVYNQAAAPAAHWILALVTLGAAFALYPSQRLNKPLGAGLIWLFIMLVADTSIRLRTPAMLLLAGMSLAVLWLVWGRNEDDSASAFPLTLWTAAVYLMTFFWHYKPDTFPRAGDVDSAIGGFVAYGALAAALATLALRKQPLLPSGKTDDYLAKGLLAASVLCAFLLFNATADSAKILAVIANLILAAFGAGCIISGARNSNEKLINRGVAVITLTAVTRFVDLFGNLLRSGMAFIVTGLAFAALAYFVNRGRKALINAARTPSPAEDSK